MSRGSSGVARAPPPAPDQGGINGSVVGSLGSTIAGMAFGIGAIVHRAVDSLMDPRVIQHETVVSSTSTSAAPTPATNSIGGSDTWGAAPTPTTNSIGSSEACGTHAKAFQDCLNSSESDISKCQSYMDMLSECTRNSGATLST